MQQAKENLELAVLSAIEHGRSSDTELAERIVATAMAAARDADDERADIYIDFIYSHLMNIPKILEETMRSTEYEFQSQFARNHIARGEAKGRLEIILELLATRFGPLPESIQTRVRGASAAQMHAIGKQVLTAQTLEQALGALD